MFCSDSLCQEVTVFGGGTNCFADFYYTYDSLGGNTNTINFYDLSTPTGLIDSWYWDFGDGNTSNEQNPVHTYSSSGIYGVCLTITADSASCTSVFCDTIVINAAQQYQLGGNVFAGIYQLDEGFAYAYQSENGTITNIFSEIMDTLGYYLFYPMVAADYYVKVEPSPSSAYTGQYMPTYYGDAITWSSAVMINVNQNVYTADINLVPMSQGVFGPGSISGSIVHGGTLRANNPAEGIQVMLRNTQDEFVGLAYTDENGIFEFSSLPHGTFTLMAEEVGLSMTPKDFVLSEDQEVIDDISMIMTQDEIYFGPSNIESLGDVTISDIYPNPVNDILKLDIGIQNPTVVSYRIVNQMGQLMQSEQIRLETNQTIELNTSSFNSGVYFVEIITEENFRLARRFVKF
jgi:PKD repeat protein